MYSVVGQDNHYDAARMAEGASTLGLRLMANVHDGLRLGGSRLHRESISST